MADNQLANAWIRVAPARVNLLGEHTDYTGGMVMPMAIPFHTEARIRRVEGAISTMSTAMFPGKRIIEQGVAPQAEGNWSDYPTGVLVEFQKLGIEVPSFDLELAGNVPFGAGLSSSASVEVATCMALLALTGKKMPTTEIALLCQRAENLFVNSPCGIMDQAVVTAAHEGHALMLNTRDLTFDLVPMNTGALAGVTVVVVNSEVKHSVATGSYGDRRREAEAGQKAMVDRFGLRDLGDATMEQVEQVAAELDPIVLKRVRHIVSENARVREAGEAMRAGDAVRMGEIMLRGHVSMRDDYEITCPEVDFLVECARVQPGCYGARMTGGGFGGCTVNLVANEQVESFTESVLRQYEAAYGIKGEVYPCHAVDGAVALSEKEQA
ncbi:MAG: galactokinase [Acidobacteriaceae bacterium]|nr:galactokinase [Acidobacteriaceae bacterium]